MTQNLREIENRDKEIAALKAQLLAAQSISAVQSTPAAALATPVVVPLKSIPIDKTSPFNGLSIEDRPDGSRKRDRDSDICHAFLKIQADRQNSDALQRAQQARQRAEHAAEMAELATEMAERRLQERHV